MSGLSGVSKLVAHAVVGGIASVAGGGKLENGAVTAAFGYMFNEAGRGPYDRHEWARIEAMAELSSAGFRIVSPNEVEATLLGFPVTRRYDCIAQDLLTNAYVGVEVKTTLNGNWKLVQSQVSFDAALNSGRFGPSTIVVDNQVVRLTQALYMGYCLGCDAKQALFASRQLQQQLLAAGIPNYRRSIKPK